MKKFAYNSAFRKLRSGPITSWQIDKETMETVTELFLGAPKSLQMLTAAEKLKDTCSVEEKLDRDTTLPTEVCLIKAMVFPVVMYGGESWTIKNAEY